MPRSSTGSPRRKRQGRLVVGEIVPQDNRTRYKVYVDENVEYGSVKTFFHRLYHVLGYEKAYTPRAQLNEAVEWAGGGHFEIKYNSVVKVTGRERRRLF